MEKDTAELRDPAAPVSDGRCLVTCRVDELRPHPSYLRHRVAVSISKLSALADRGDLAFFEPLTVARDGTIIDGYARWELARQQGRVTLQCLQYELSEAEALQWILRTHQRSDGLNAFNKTVLGLDLEQSLRERARSNQRAGGQHKGSSNLTEAERLDVRAEIAAAAGVSVGNVSKVKYLLTAAHPDVLEALRSKEISIHRAWNWSKLPAEDQRAAFSKFRDDRGIKKFIRTTISRHRAKRASAVGDLPNLVQQLAACESAKLRNVTVSVIKSDRDVIFISETLLQVLELGKMDLCVTSGR